MSDLERHLARAQRLLVLAPHPDDETLGTGGLLQRAASMGVESRVLFLTDGDDNPWAQRLTERRWRITAPDRARWGARRRLEAIQALKLLGVAPAATSFAGLPDQHVTERLIADPEAVVRRVTDEIEAWEPGLLLAPALDDLHPDHGATAVIAALALERCVRRPLAFGYRIHPAGHARAATGTVALPLTASERDVKRRAVGCHVSQHAWRRRQLLAFVDPPERFTLAVPEYRARRDPPLQLRHAVPGALTFAWRRSLRVRLGKVALLLAVDTGQGISTLAVEFPEGGGPRRRFVPWTGHGQGACAEVTLHATARFVGASIRSTPSLLDGRCFAKLDARRERGVGGFDPWRWIAFDVDPPSLQLLRGDALRAEPALGVASQRFEDPGPAATRRPM